MTGLQQHHMTGHDRDTLGEDGGNDGNGYGCGDCSVSFSSFEELCEHMESEHSENEKEVDLNESGTKHEDDEGSDMEYEIEEDNKGNGYDCEVCSKSFKTQFSLAGHMFVHSGPMCLKCRMSFKSSAILEKHMKKNPTICKRTVLVRKFLSENVENNKSLECKFCNEHFSNKYDLQMHHFKVHGMKPVYECTLCDKDYTNKWNAQDMVRHIFEKHIPEANTNQPKIKENHCHLCQLTFGNKACFLKHNTLHTGLVCPKCKASFKNTEQLEKHKKESPQTCQDAYMARMFLNTAENHMKFNCIPCKSGFSNSFDLKRHQLRVHGIKPDYICSMCETQRHPCSWQNYCAHVIKCHINNKEMAVDSKTVEESRDTEFDQKSYSNQNEKATQDTHDNSHCPKCSRQFTEAEELMNHLKDKFTVCQMNSNVNKFLELKTPDNLFICTQSECSDFFKTTLDLNEHLKKAHNMATVFDCPLCSKSYGDAQNGIDHKYRFLKHVSEVHIKEKSKVAPFKKHKREKQFSCPNCNNNFSSPAELDEHIHSKPFCIQYKTLLISYSENNPHVQHKAKCYFCLATFRTLFDLDQHQMNHHSITPAYWCEHCDQKYTGKLDFLTHMKEYHTEKENSKRKLVKQVKLPPNLESLRDEPSVKKCKMDSIHPPTVEECSNTTLDNTSSVSTPVQGSSCPSCTSSQCQKFSFWEPLPGGNDVICRFPSCHNSQLSASATTLQTKHINIYHSDHIPDASCLDCGIYFGGPCAWNNLQRHINKLHNTKSLGMMKCEHCTFQTINKVMALEHLRENHPERLG